MRLWINRAIAIGVIVMFVQPTTSAAAPKPALAVLGSDSTVTITATEGEDTATGYFSLLNSGRKAVKIAVAFQAASSEQVTIESVTPSRLGRNGAQRVSVTFAGLESLDDAVTGQLIVTGGRVAVAQAVAINPAPHPSAPWSSILIGGTLALALILMVAVIGAMPSNNRSPLSNPAPGPKWSFSSWATTLTAVGAVFGTVLASATFPTYPSEISKQALVNLNIFFGILVVLGPFLFQALRKSDLSEVDEQEGRTGTNMTLLIACTVTLWAVIGQLAAFTLLGWELLGGGTMGTLAVVAAVAIGLLALRYYWVTTSAMVLRSWPLPQPAEVEAALRPMDVSDVEHVYLRTVLPGAAITRLRDRTSAEITLPPLPERGPPSWPLL